MPEISKEVQSLRGENSKTFDIGKGKRRLEAHIGAIHYKNNYADPSEQWKDIDLTWEGNKITKAPYELTLDGKKLILKDKKTGEVSTIELLESKPAGLKWEIIPEYSAVRFRHTLPSDKVPFEAKFKVTGKIPFRTRALDDEGELELETSLADGILTEKLSSLPRPAKGSIRIDPTWQVVASTDDCARRITPAFWSLTGDYMIVGSSGATYYQWGSGMRFPNITIAKDATIDEAYLTLRCLYSRSDTVVNSRISAEDVDDAPTFADDADAFDTRFANHTTARVDWDAIPGWTANTDYNGPEIKTVIQEIVNRGGWVSGQDMVIFWEDYDDRSDHGSNVARYAISYDNNSTYAPKLVITYTPPVVAPTVTAQAVDDIAPITATGNGTITDTGGENCSKRGICWNTGGNPTVADDKSEETDSFGTGVFDRPMTGLSPATHYYVRAYAYNSAGYGYGTQVEFTTNKDCTSSDTGSGADAKASGNPLATFPVRSETGGGVDGHKAVAPQSAGETGEGVDALFALLAAMARAETGSGVEHLLVRAIMASQTGSGVEHILDRVLVLISESGTGLDVSHLVKTLLLTETGTGVENSYLHILAGVKSSSDSGSGAEASSLAALFQRDETGEGVESIVARALYAREYPTGALDLAKVITAAITGAETGTGAEASLRAVFFKRDETGIGVDTSTLAALFTGEDSGAGAEAITLLAAMLASDSGQSVETVLSYLRQVVDSGKGEEVVNIIGAVGRAMKLITYLRAYSDLVVYTKPYSNLIVYTSEVKQ